MQTQPSTDTPPMGTPMVLALDIGSSSIRALLFDDRGRLVPGMESRDAEPFPGAGQIFSNIPARDLLQAILGCIDRILELAGERATDIVAVAGCSFVSNLVGIDGHGEPLTTLTTYADTDSEEDAGELHGRHGGNHSMERSGCPWHPSFLPARLRMHARTDPGTFARVRRWVTIGELLELELFGDCAVTLSVASWSGLLNRKSLQWDPDLLTISGISGDQLSPLTDIDRPRRGLCPSYAERWPSLASIPWYPVVGDGAAANIGSGAAAPGKIAVTMGTSTAIRTVIPGTPGTVPPGLFCYRVDRRRALVGGALNEGGGAYAWLSRLLRFDDPDLLERDLLEREPGSHGLTVLPFLTGERSPGWVGHARGTIHGLTPSTTPHDMIQAFLEAILYRIGLVHGLLLPLLPPEHEVIAGGGAFSASPALVHMLADVLGTPVTVSREEEVSARGAVLLALENMDLIQDIEHLEPDFDDSRQTDEALRHIQPDMDRHRAHEAARARQSGLYETLVRPMAGSRHDTPTTTQGIKI